MALTISKILSSVLEILLLGAVPFVWWYFTAGKKIKFPEWIGLKKTGLTDRKAIVTGYVCTLLLFVGLALMTSLLMKDVDTATSEFTGLGIAGLPAALIWAIFNTSLPEEILFRGFLQKRISAKLGYLKANIIQSLLFGLLHGVLFFSAIGIIRTLLVIAYTGTVAFAMAYINEIKANGSILPSWAIHGSANIIASVFALFSLI